MKRSSKNEAKNEFQAVNKIKIKKKNEFQVVNKTKIKK
jgi:hypothetical protein